jgi:hypothetical protein
MNNQHPGFPLVETPLLLAMADEMGLSAEARCIGRNLFEHGCAVFNSPDPAIEARMERIKHRLSPRYRMEFGDPQADKTIGERRIQDA